MSSLVGFTRMLVELMESLPLEEVTSDEREVLFQLLQAFSMYLDPEQRTTLAMRMFTRVIHDLQTREATTAEVYAVMAMMNDLVHLWDGPPDSSRKSTSLASSKVIRLHKQIS